MTKTVNHWIGGKTVEGASGTYGGHRPGDRRRDHTGRLRDRDEVDAAVAVAKDAYATWGQSSLAKRSTILFKFRALLDANRTRSPSSSPPSTARCTRTRSARWRAVWRSSTWRAGSPCS